MSERHELVLTFEARTKHRQSVETARWLLVRCRCMTGPPGRDAIVHGGGYSPRFYGYDWLARLDSKEPGYLERALAAYREHVRSAGSLDP